MTHNVESIIGIGRQLDNVFRRQLLDFQPFIVGFSIPRRTIFSILFFFLSAITLFLAAIPAFFSLFRSLLLLFFFLLHSCNNDCIQQRKISAVYLYTCIPRYLVVFGWINISFVFMTDYEKIKSKCQTWPNRHAKQNHATATWMTKHSTKHKNIEEKKNQKKGKNPKMKIGFTFKVAIIWSNTFRSPVLCYPVHNLKHISSAIFP